MSTAELACSYAVLALQDAGVNVTAENISKMLKASGVRVEAYWPSLFANLAESRNIKDMITNVGAAPAAAPAAAAPSAGAASSGAAAKDEPKKKEEKKEEEDEDMGFGLFD